MSNTNSRPSTLAIIVGILTIVTGLVHFAAGINTDDTMFRWLFILNGLGYVALAIAYLFPNMTGGNHTAVKWTLLVYTAITFVLYFVFNGSDAFANALGLGDKGVELVIIILLLVDIMRSRRAA